jgi:glutathione synthase/RimK-type ligase-like ATP-grasp enzyme
MVDVVLATGQVMPHGPAVENELLVDALRDRGVSAVVEPWGSPAAADARLVVVRTTWDYTDHVVDFLAWVHTTAATTLVVNPAEVVVWNHHKSYLLDLAYAAVPVLPTALVAQGSPAADQRAVLDEHASEVVIKPAVGVGANGALRVDPNDPAAIAHLSSITASGDALIQPFEPSVTRGEVSLIYFGGSYSHAVRKVPAAGDFRVHVFYGGMVEPHEPSVAELSVAASAIAAVSHDLAYARVDLVETERGPVLMELELIEPQLFLDQPGEAAARFADHLTAKLSDSHRALGG